MKDKGKDGSYYESFRIYPNGDIESILLSAVKGFGHRVAKYHGLVQRYFR